MRRYENNSCGYTAPVQSSELKVSSDPLGLWCGHMGLLYFLLWCS